MYGEGLLLHQGLLGGHEEHVVLLQGHIGHAALHDAVYIYGYYLQGTVGLHTVHHGMGRKCLLGAALGMLYERANTGYVAAHLVFAGAEHGSLDLDHVLVAIQD